MYGKLIFSIRYLLLLSIFAIFLQATAFSKARYFSSYFHLTDTIPQNVIFDRVEVEAMFPGGLEAWREFLSENLRPEIPVKKKAPVGKYMVVVQFIVDKDGSLMDFNALTNHGYGMEKEVIRILKKSPNWTPARQNGRPVRAYRKQPVTFQVTEE